MIPILVMLDVEKAPATMKIEQIMMFWELKLGLPS